MKRIFPATDTAKQAAWCKTTGGIHIPETFEIDGFPGHWTVHALDAQKCGFVIFKTKTIKRAVELIEELNGHGVTPKVQQWAEPFAFAWKHYPIG